MNHCVYSGRLTANPEPYYTPTGKLKVSFTLAVKRTYVGKDGKRMADFVNVAVWGNRGDACLKNLIQGQVATVEDEEHDEGYTNKDGRKIKYKVLVADNVEFGPKPRMLQIQLIRLHP
jgi:single-strand DNA-binding protein